LSDAQERQERVVGRNRGSLLAWSVRRIILIASEKGEKEKRNQSLLESK